MQTDPNFARFSPRTIFSLLLVGMLFFSIVLTQFATQQSRDARSQAADCSVNASFNVTNPTSIQPSWSGWDGHYYSYVFKNGLTREQANSENKGWKGHNSLDSDGRTTITASGLEGGGIGYTGEVYLHGTTNVVKWASVSITTSQCPSVHVTLTADSTSIGYNSSTTLRWTSSNATSCTASGAWSGGKATAGNQTTGNLVSTRTYNINCTGAGASDSDSVTINVAAAPPPPVNPPPPPVNPPPPPVNPPPPPPVGVNPPPPPVNPPPPPPAGCIFFCTPPPPPPALVTPPQNPSGSRLTPPGQAASQPAANGDITLNFASNPYLKGGMEVIVGIDGTGVSQKIVVEKAGGSFILKPGTLSKGVAYRLTVSAKNSLIVAVSFNYSDNLSLSVPVIVTGNFNNDDQVNNVDLDKFLESGFATQDLLYDINYDSVVNSIDYSLLLLNLGKSQS